MLTWVIASDARCCDSHVHFTDREVKFKGKLGNLTKDTGLMSGRCGIQTQVEESSILAHNHKVVYLHELYSRHMKILRHDDCHPHLTDGQIESLRAKISYPVHTGSQWL